MLIIGDKVNSLCVGCRCWSAGKVSLWLTPFTNCQFTWETRDALQHCLQCHTVIHDELSIAVWSAEEVNTRTGFIFITCFPHNIGHICPSNPYVSLGKTWPSNISFPLRRVRLKSEPNRVSQFRTRVAGSVHFERTKRRCLGDQNVYRFELIDCRDWDSGSLVRPFPCDCVWHNPIHFTFRCSDVELVHSCVHQWAKLY